MHGLDFTDGQQDMLNKRRKGQRRRCRPVPYFPLQDIYGNTVMRERRYMPDRRLNDNLFDAGVCYVYSKPAS